MSISRLPANGSFVMNCFGLFVNDLKNFLHSFVYWPDSWYYCWEFSFVSEYMMLFLYNLQSLLAATLAFVIQVNRWFVPVFTVICWQMQLTLLLSTAQLIWTSGTGLPLMWKVRELSRSEILLLVWENDTYRSSCVTCCSNILNEY